MYWNFQNSEIYNLKYQPKYKTRNELHKLTVQKTHVEKNCLNIALRDYMTLLTSKKRLR